ncbi:MAG: hypothetical protein ACYTX0_30860 [Nostoc sp.]
MQEFSENFSFDLVGSGCEWGVGSGKLGVRSGKLGVRSGELRVGSGKLAIAN